MCNGCNMFCCAGEENEGCGCVGCTAERCSFNYGRSDIEGAAWFDEADDFDDFYDPI